MIDTIIKSFSRDISPSKTVSKRIADCLFRSPEPAVPATFDVENEEKLLDPNVASALDEAMNQ